MPDEEVVVAQDQVEVEQVQDPEPSEEESVEDVVEGFEQEAEEPEPEVEEEPEKPTEPVESPLEGEIKELKQKVHDLNRALHKTRQEKPEQKEEESLTPEQLKTLLNEHKDDPDTLYNIMNYIGKQAAKEGSKEIFDTQKTLDIRNKTQTFLHTRYPELKDPESQASKRVQEFCSQYNLGDHPAGEYFAASAIIADNIESLQKQWFEKGKAAGLGEKAEKNRKQTVKDATLLPGGKPTVKKSSGLQGSLKTTASQMGLTASQAKIMAQLVNGGANG